MVYTSCIDQYQEVGYMKKILVSGFSILFTLAMVLQFDSSVNLAVDDRPIFNDLPNQH